MPQVLQRGFQIAFLPQSHTQVHVRRQTVRFERQRLLKHLHGLGKVATFRKDRTQVGVGTPVRRVQSHGLPQRSNRAWKVGLFGQRDAQPIVRLRGGRPNLHRALERRQRTRVIILVPVRQAELNVGFGIAGIALDGRLKLAQRYSVFGLLRANCCRAEQEHRDAGAQEQEGRAPGDPSLVGLQEAKL